MPKEIKRAREMNYAFARWANGRHPRFGCGAGRPMLGSFRLLFVEVRCGSTRNQIYLYLRWTRSFRNVGRRHSMVQLQKRSGCAGRGQRSRLEVTHRRCRLSECLEDRP